MAPVEMTARTGNKCALIRSRAFDIERLSFVLVVLADYWHREPSYGICHFDLRRGVRTFEGVFLLEQR